MTRNYLPSPDWTSLERDTRRYIYHYTRAETALNHILPTGQIRLGPISNANDAREAKLLGFTVLSKDILNRTGPWGGKVTDALMAPDVKQHRRMADAMSAKLTSNVKFLCLSRDHKPSTTDDPGYHRGYARPAMWAYYAGNHTGICLVFDRQQLAERISATVTGDEIFWFGNVSYPKRLKHEPWRQAFNLDPSVVGNTITEQFVRAHAKQHYRELFLRKHPDWQTEKEWRALIYSESREVILVDYRNALKGIVLGAGIEPETLRAITSYANGTGITVLAMNWATLSMRGFGSLQYLPIKLD